MQVVAESCCVGILEPCRGCLLTRIPSWKGGGALLRGCPTRLCAKAACRRVVVQSALSTSEQGCLASLDLLHTHLALAGTPCHYHCYYCYYYHAQAEHAGQLGKHLQTQEMSSSLLLHLSKASQADCQQLLCVHALASSAQMRLLEKHSMKWAVGHFVLPGYS